MADADWGDPIHIAWSLAASGCRVIQLRAKHATLAEIAAQARVLLPQLHAQGVRLLINDHLSVAVAVGADGVHLGQGDGDPHEARAQLGPRALVGISTHSLEQALAAQSIADYIGFGPVFSTATKDTGYTARGLLALHQVVKMSRIPVVAIGGITRARLTEVRATGVRHWAVIRDILEQEDICGAARKFQVLE